MEMEATSRSVSAPPFKPKVRRADAFPLSGSVELRRLVGRDRWGVRCCCPDSVLPIRRNSGSGKSADKCEEWRIDPRNTNRALLHGSPAMTFASPQSRFVSKPEKFSPRCAPRNSGPQSRDCPPKRDTGIANEKDWGITLLNENIKESGTNEDSSTWFRESGEDLGENGYRCRWARMGGRNQDNTSEWKETWWEKSDWSGYKELGVEKSGKNSEGDTWWETWREVLHQDEWSNLARIERSAQKQAKSGTENAGWYENWEIGAKPSNTPMIPNVQLTHEGVPFEDPERYRRLVGKLNYLAVTHPYIAYSVSVVSQYMSSSTVDHWKAVEHILCYLKGTPEIVYENHNHMRIECFADADWAGSKDDRRSTSGYCVFVGGNLVSWKSKKLNVVSRSSAESEYRAMAQSACEIIWINHLLSEKGLKTPMPVKLWCDNQAAIHIANNPVFHERTKHIEVDCHFVREKIQQGLISTGYVKTGEQLGDLFTKALNGIHVGYLCNKLGMINIYAPT